MVTEFVDNRAIVISGAFFRIAKVRDEPYDCIDDGNRFIDQVKQAGVRADLFSFSQEIGDQKPKYPYHQEWDRFAVLPLSTYEKWFSEQINFKTRNKVRKAQKAGVQLRVMEFDDDMVRHVMGIYNESPVIQGRANWHYGKDSKTMKGMLGTFPERSQFVGAWLKDELIGFIKLVYGRNVASLMHIISKAAHRDKAPTNALLAKAIELSAGKKLSYLHFGIWSRRGLGVFKMNHAFVPHELPRYYVPLNLKGEAMLRLKLHHKLKERLPESWIDTGSKVMDDQMTSLSR